MSIESRICCRTSARPLHETLQLIYGMTAIFDPLSSGADATSFGTAFGIVGLAPGAKGKRERAGRDDGNREEDASNEPAP
jgi:hypothetical protein